MPVILTTRPHHKGRLPSQDTGDWHPPQKHLNAQLRASYSSRQAECNENSTAIEPMILRGGELPNARGMQEELRQPPGGSPLVWIAALSRGLDLMTLEAPSSSIILGFLLLILNFHCWLLTYFHF